VIWTCSRKDLGVAGSASAPTLAFERFGDHGGTTASAARDDHLIYKGHQLIGEAHSDLNAHTGMVPKRER
jgi:hypothetical protein